MGHHEKSSETIYKDLKNELKKLLSSDTGNQLKKFIEEYIEDLRSFFQAFLDLLDEIDRNPLVFKAFLLEKINPLFYNSLVRLKINNSLNDEILHLITKADILLFKISYSPATAYKPIHSLPDKEKFSKELKKGCNRSLIMKAKQYISVDPLYYPASFHYIFFEQNCPEMSIEDLKSLIKEKKLTQEQEHIVPLSWHEREEIVEIQKLGFEDIKDLENHINTYGNLLSLEGSLNSKAKDKDLLSKKAIYEESKIAFVRRFDSKRFDKQKIIERNNELEKWLEMEFFKDFLN